MRLREIFRFELAYQVRRAWPWLIFTALVLFAYQFVRVNFVGDALYADFYVNSPFLIAGSTVIGSLIWLLLGAVVAGEAAARDVATGMYPLTYTAPVGKATYLGGRFLAALALNTLLLLGVQVGILLGVYLPGVPPGMVGPFRLAAFASAFGFIALPNAFVATALQFTPALRSGRAMAGYLGSLSLIFMGFFVASILFFKRSAGSLLDPVGIRFIVEDLAHEWTTIEQNTRLLGLEGTVLTNRLLWVGVALVVIAVTYRRFRFAHRVEGAWWRRRRNETANAPVPARPSVMANAISVPQVSRAFGFTFHVRQTLAVAWASFRTTATSWAGLALLIVVPMVTVLVVIDQMSALGVPLIPRTMLVLRELTGGLSAELSAEPNRWLIVPLFIIFFAGELVWREREAGLGEIAGAMPGSDWAPYLGKFLGLGLVLAVFLAILTAAGMLAQAILGYRDFEVVLYLKILYGLQLPEYLLFAMLALTVHVLVDQKYVGYLAAVLAYVFIAVLASMLGIEHNLLIYGASPAWSYTEMRGFGGSLGPWLWFKLYWAAWALLLAVAARLFWIRGKERGIGVRVRLARRRLTVPTIRVAGVAIFFIVTLGGFIFYNTNVLNEYVSGSGIDERRAEYERRYRRYEFIPQPRLAAANLRLELYPGRRAAEIRGTYQLVNDGAEPIDSIHVATALGVADTRAMTFDRTARLAVDDDKHGYRIYALERSLQPGDTVRLEFQVRVEPQGFGNRGVNPWVTANGSFISREAWFPFIGYQRFREILSPGDRRAHGLPPRPILASLYETEGREPTTRGGGTVFEAVVGTDADQVAVAPGALRRTWTERGRRYFHYATETPIGSEWAFFSARYAQSETRWNDPEESGRDVVIRIYHDPEHTAQLDRMQRSARASLDYYTRAFGPYPYGHLSLVEHPAAPGTGAHADAGLITYGQGYAFWIPRDEQSFDLPYAVIGHEMAHQWTVPYALVEGLPFLSEGLAWYSALQMVKASRGEDQVRQLLAFMRQPYPFRPIRRGEPLLRALDPYLAYRKGPFALYALSEYAGADRVNGAIRRLIERHDRPGVPPATTLDLYRELQAAMPDSLQYLLRDLFEVNTYWDLTVNEATAEQTAGGAWQVKLDVRARKVVADSAGVQTDVPMDETIPIGVFGAAGPGGGELSAPLYLKRHRIRSGAQTITVNVPRAPVLAGIDPYHLLDVTENEDDDNIEGVTITSARAPVNPRMLRLED